MRKFPIHFLVSVLLACACALNTPRIISVSFSFIPIAIHFSWGFYFPIASHTRRPLPVCRHNASQKQLCFHAAAVVMLTVRAWFHTPLKIQFRMMLTKNGRGKEIVSDRVDVVLCVWEAAISGWAWTAGKTHSYNQICVWVCVCLRWLCGCKIANNGRAIDYTCNILVC